MLHSIKNSNLPYLQRYPLKVEDEKLLRALRSNVITLVNYLQHHVADCPARTLALQHIREGLMWGEEAILSAIHPNAVVVDYAPLKDSDSESWSKVNARPDPENQVLIAIRKMASRVCRSATGG